jgi:glycosyltransferase involved in cell wall biosynthesis
MKIHLDDIIYQIQTEGGISTFWSEITSRIQKTLLFDVARSKGSKLSRFLPVLSDADIFHSSYFRVPISLTRKVKTVVTVHDLVYEELIQTDKSLNVVLNTWQRRQAINTANAIVCISETTKKDLLEFYPHLQMREKDIFTIYHGISFSPKDLKQVDLQSKRLGELLATVNGKYLLFVGGRQSYKNFNVAIKAFANSLICQEKDYNFICTGKDFTSAEIDFITKLGIANKVKILPHSTTAELVWLYRQAHALIYISSCEGFGLPPLEAMSCDCPVIISTCAALVEIAGEASLIVEPDNLVSVVGAIDKLSDIGIREHYIGLGKSKILNFDWDDAANRYLDVYQHLINK